MNSLIHGLPQRTLGHWYILEINPTFFELAFIELEVLANVLLFYDSPPTTADSKLNLQLRVRITDPKERQIRQLCYHLGICDLIRSSLIPRDYLVVWNERTQVFKFSFASISGRLSPEDSRRYPQVRYLQGT